MPILVLPAVEIALLAILCALVYFGVPILIKLITLILPTDLPVIGDRLVRAVESAGAWAESKMKAALLAQLHWASQLIRTPVASIKRHLNFLALTVGSLYHMGHTIVTVTIPHQVSALTRHMLHLYVAALAYTKMQATILFHRDDVLHLRAILYAATHIETLRRVVYAAIASAAHYAKTEIAVANHRIDVLAAHTATVIRATETRLNLRMNQLYAAALAQVSSAVAALGHTVDQLYRQAIAHADQVAITAATAATGALEHETATVLARAWPGLIDDVRGLEDVLGTDLAQIGSAVRSIDLTQTRSIAEGLAVSTAIGTAALRYMRDCGVPNCRNLGALGHVLHDIGLLIDGDELISLITEFVHDPAGAAHTVIDETGAVINDLAGGFRHLIGL